MFTLSQKTIKRPNSVAFTKFIPYIPPTLSSCASSAAS